MKAFTPKLLIVLCFVIFSCDSSNDPQIDGGKIYTISGYAQKGPFTIGSDITIAELNEGLFPTGRVFFATILNNEGYFELPGILLNSPYVLIKAEGQYLSEIFNLVQSDRLTLFAIADISMDQSINVNILTHLEKERVEKLVQEENMSFVDAKTKAFEELLTIFGWEDLTSGAENLNITESNSGGAALLAASAIVEHTQLLFSKRLEVITNFRIDFAEDGDLDSERIQNLLLTSAYTLNLNGVRQTLSTHYGDGVDIPDFESYVHHFVSTSDYVNYIDIIFPKDMNGKVNLLRDSSGVIDPTKQYGIRIQPLPLSDEFEIRLYFFQEFSEENRFTVTSEKWTEVSPGYTCALNKNFVDAVIEDNNISFNGHGSFLINLSIQIDGMYIAGQREVTW